MRTCAGQVVLCCHLAALPGSFCMCVPLLCSFLHAATAACGLWGACGRRRVSWTASQCALDVVLLSARRNAVVESPCLCVHCLLSQLVSDRLRAGWACRITPPAWLVAHGLRRQSLIHVVCAVEDPLPVAVQVHVRATCSCLRALGVQAVVVVS